MAQWLGEKMSFRTDRNGNRFPIRPTMKLFYRVMVTHSPEGYDPYTVEYGMAERSMSDAVRTLERAKKDFPTSKAYIDTVMLETY
jgi:hypothetical protein